LINNATEVLGVEPVYRLNSGLTQNKLVKILDVALEVAEELKILPESLPNDVLEDLGWPSFVDAIKTQSLVPLAWPLQVYWMSHIYNNC
jgi:RecG-like helicase